MKITKITSQIKKPGRFNVFIDEQFWLGVSADTLARFKLYDGLELSDNDASEITKAEIRSRLIERAYTYVSRSMKPRAKVRMYLKNLLFKKKGDWLGDFNVKSFEETIEEILDSLEKTGAIDDAAFAKSFVEIRANRKQRSHSVIMKELLQKGINRETAENAISDSGCSDLEMLKTLLTKKYGNIEVDSKDKKKVRYILGKGFSWEIISQLTAHD